MFNEYKSGVYTDGEHIFELDVGVAISIRTNNGRVNYPADLSIYFEDIMDRRGMHIMDWFEKYVILNDRERASKVLKHSVYLGDL